jgi:hypothetical protein
MTDRHVHHSQTRANTDAVSANAGGLSYFLKSDSEISHSHSSNLRVIFKHVMLVCRQKNAW